MGEHHVRLTIDENNLVTEINPTYTTIKDNEQFDNCVVCGKPSPYKTSTHIDYRIGYVEGAGQGCFKSNGCIESNQSEREMIMIPKNLVEKFPNNMQLGEAVRKYFWENYK